MGGKSSTEYSLSLTPPAHTDPSSATLTLSERQPEEAEEENIILANRTTSLFISGCRFTPVTSKTSPFPILQYLNKLGLKSISGESDSISLPNDFSQLPLLYRHVLHHGAPSVDRLCEDLGGQQTGGPLHCHRRHSVVRL